MPAVTSGRTKIKRSEWVILISLIALGLIGLFVVEQRSVNRDAMWTSHCNGNCRFIDHAKGVYAIKNGLKIGATITSNQVWQYVGGTNDTEWDLICFDGGYYIIGPIDTASSCSIHN